MDEAERTHNMDVLGDRKAIRSNDMYNRSLALAAAILLYACGSSFAQSVSIDIAPEQRTRIKEYVVKERVPTVTMKERYRVGTPVPADVELREVPADWGPSVRR